VPSRQLNSANAVISPTFIASRIYIIIHFNYPRPRFRPFVHSRSAAFSVEGNQRACLLPRCHRADTRRGHRTRIAFSWGRTNRLPIKSLSLRTRRLEIIPRSTQSRWARYKLIPCSSSLLIKEFPFGSNSSLNLQTQQVAFPFEPSFEPVDGPFLKLFVFVKSPLRNLLHQFLQVAASSSRAQEISAASAAFFSSWNEENMQC